MVSVAFVTCFLIALSAGGASASRSAGPARASRGGSQGKTAIAGALAVGANAVIGWYSWEPRAKFVKKQMKDLEKKYGRFNIIIFKRGHGKWLENPQGIIPGGKYDVKFTGTGPDTWFSILIFSGKGKFERSGDGGFHNWSFRGWYTRQGNKVVTFRQSPRAG